MDLGLPDSVLCGAAELLAGCRYGCLGFSASRFFARPLAELVTAQGRDILQSTVDLVHGTIGAEVNYVPLYACTGSFARSQKPCITDLCDSGMG